MTVKIFSHEAKISRVDSVKFIVFAKIIRFEPIARRVDVKRLFSTERI